MLFSIKKGSLHGDEGNIRICSFIKSNFNSVALSDFDFSSFVLLVFLHGIMLLTKLTNIDNFLYNRYTFPSEVFAFTLNWAYKKQI